MAKQYFATTKIIHGRGESGEVVFEPGQRVTGLTKQDMIALWNSGALTEVDPNAVVSTNTSLRIEELEREIAALKASQVAAAPDTSEEVEALVEPKEAETPADILP